MFTEEKIAIRGSCCNHFSVAWYFCPKFSSCSRLEFRCYDLCGGSCSYLQELLGQFLFGYKTCFYFPWEDIEDVQFFLPSLSSVGSPPLVIVLHKGRGFDARHGAKSQDEEGRLRFYFQSFFFFFFYKP